MKRAVVGLLLLAGVAVTGCRYVSIGDLYDGGYAFTIGSAIHTSPQDLSTAGDTLPSLEARIKGDPQFRDAISRADLVTLSIGGIDLMTGFQPYLNDREPGLPQGHSCGGYDDQGCVWATVSNFELVYQRVLDELRGLTRAQIRVLDIYDPGNDIPSYGYPSPVLTARAEINTFIHTQVCARSNMFPAYVALAFNGADGRGDPGALYYTSTPGITTPLGEAIIAKAVAGAHC